MNHFAKIFALGTALVASVTMASATPLTLNVVGAGTYGTATGASVSGSLTPASNAGDPTPYTAAYTEQVYVGGTSPFTYCSTCLTFVFSFTNNGSVVQNDPITQVSMSSFGSFLTTAGYVTDGPSVAPNSATRTGLVASTVTFNFDAGVGTGQTSDIFMVFTNATNYAAGVINFADGAVVSGPALLPSAATPEPSSLMLLGTGLVSAAGMLVRRRRIV